MLKATIALFEICVMRSNIALFIMIEYILFAEFRLFYFLSPSRPLSNSHHHICPQILKYTCHFSDRNSRDVFSAIIKNGLEDSSG